MRDGGRLSAGEDATRPKYGFSQGKWGATAAACPGRTRHKDAQGANAVVASPDILDAFPDGAAVKEALRALARIRSNPEANSGLPTRFSGRSAVRNPGSAGESGAFP